MIFFTHIFGHQNYKENLFRKMKMSLDVRKRIIRHMRPAKI